MMERLEHYFIGEREVSKEIWFEVYNDFNNFETLTIKYEDARKRNSEKVEEAIEDLKRQVAELKKDRKNWNSTPVYPWTYPDLGKIEYADWTVRPEHIFVYELTPSNPNKYFSVTC